MSINYRNCPQDGQRHLESLENREKKDRLINIQKKIQTITLFKQNQLKNEIQEQVTKRVLDVEQKLTEQVKGYEWQVRQIRQQLSQCKLKEDEMSKKCDLFRRQRMTEIIDLHKKITTLLQYESKERKQLQTSMILLSEHKIQNFIRELTAIKETRRQLLNNFETKLENSLPQLQFIITSSSQAIQDQFQTIYSQINEEISFLKQNIERQQVERQNGIKKVMQFINEIVIQIKNDMSEQKMSRQQNHCKLFKLFDKAYGKFNML